MSGSARLAEDEPDVDAGSRHSGVSRTGAALIGTVIDERYRVEALLGEGGMGLVYRVQHVQLHKPLAIKVLRRENIREEEVLARFQREAQSASNIGNEHIVDIHDFGTLPDGSTYFVMECLEGLDLIDALDSAHRLPETRAVHIARQICVALGAAHGAGIVHRDLKPENVFLTRRGDDEDFVKVLDFGIAKVANRPHRLTRDGEVLGTPHYMSPEQCAGDDIDHRTDIYALGVLLYEMVTGHVPHDADSMMAILTKQMYEDPVAPRVRVPSLSLGLEQVILRSLEKKPSQRYQTMQDMEADLARLESGQRLAGPDTLRIKPAPPRRKAFLRARTLVLLLAAVVGAGLTVAAVFGAFEEQDPVAPPTNASVAPSTKPAPSEPEVQGPSPAPMEAVVSKPDGIRVEAPTERRRRRVRRTEPANLKDDEVQGPILDPWK